MSAVVAQRFALTGVRAAMEQQGHKTHQPHGRANEQGIVVWTICCSTCGACTESVVFGDECEVIRDTATVEPCKHNPNGRRYYL